MDKILNQSVLLYNIRVINEILLPNEAIGKLLKVKTISEM